MAPEEGFSKKSKAEAIAALIKQHSPDIVALQEVDCINISHLSDILEEQDDYVQLGEAPSHAGLACMPFCQH
jgi:endonuclease/exonuclease/phosphatase family metal-dependent hydrolase